MFRRIFLSMLMFILASMMHVSAESLDDYDWLCEYEFAATPVVWHENNGEFEHSMYYFRAGDNKCLVVVCHGFVDDNKRYGIFMNNKYRYDYAQAVAESIAYWTQKGKLKNVGDFDYVFINTCHSGYAPHSTKLPTYNINLVRAIDHKGYNGFQQAPASNGQVMLKFFRLVKKQAPAPRVPSALANMLEQNGVRSYRSVRSRSSSRPAGVIVLSDQFEEEFDEEFEEGSE